MLIYGHRGAGGEAPENTLDGFLYARRMYLDGVTFDVRLSSDGQIVAIHDETVERTTTGRGKVAGLRADKLARLDARGAFPHWPAACGIPTIEDVLDACSGINHLMINVPADDRKRVARLADSLVEVLKRRCVPGRATIVSSSADVLQTVALQGPELPRALLGSFEDPEQLQDALHLGCHQIAIPASTGSAVLVRVARHRGLGVIGWLGNGANEVRDFVNWGVDAIVSDFPSIARRALPAPA